MTGDVINHLWQSTVFAAFIALLAAALRKNRARVRFGLWLAASIKFLLPFSLLVGLGRQLESAPAAQMVVQNTGPETFEVVSIRPADPNPVARGGRGGGGGDGGGGLLAPCSGGAQLTAGRININNATLFRLITAAYGMNCRAALEIGLVSGLPDWASKERFDIQATIPAGTPAYTMDQLQFGEAPKLQAMLTNMLADRFGLVLHRGSKDAALYNLVFVRGDKIKLSEDQTPPGPPPPPGTFVRRDPSLPPPPPPRGLFSLGVSPNEGLVMFSASAIPIRTLINIFQGQEARFVVDKTGMKGLYDVPFVTMNVGPFDVTPGALSVWPEIMQQLGLKLEPARGPLDTLIIDRVERPSAN